MATLGAQKRLTKEYKRLIESPVDLIEAHPEESNILIWHYVITGPPNTPFYGGQYHGVVSFPPQYPFKPPGIKMITPNGKFTPNQRLCLSISDYHPETWNPSWTVGTILTGLLSFMTGNEMTSGSISTTLEQKRHYARQSKEFNKRSPSFIKEFGHLLNKPAKKIGTIVPSQNSALSDGTSQASSSNTAAPILPQEQQPTQQARPKFDRPHHHDIPMAPVESTAGDKRHIQEVEPTFTLKNTGPKHITTAFIDLDDDHVSYSTDKLKSSTKPKRTTHVATEVIDLDDEDDDSMYILEEPPKQKKKHSEPDVFIID